MRQRDKQAPQSAEETVRDIRRATRRQFSAEEKIRIVLEGLRGEDSIAELCRKEGIALVGGLVPVHLAFVFANVFFRDLTRGAQCVDAGFTQHVAVRFHARPERGRPHFEAVAIDICLLETRTDRLRAEDLVEYRR